MTSQRIGQTNQQHKSETAKASGILQRAAVRSHLDVGVQFEEQEPQPLSNSAFSNDFSQVPVSTTQPQPIMAKLMIGAVGNKYEQEADRVAAQVVQRINAPASIQSGEDETVQRETMETKDNEARLMMSPILQRMSNSGMTATPNLEASINQARGGGQPLPDNIRLPMEQAFGANFSRVNVHTDSQSDQLSQSIQAKAFTTGQDVFFRQGEYNPGSREGQELLAHELTHVVQQNGETVQRSLFNSPQQSSVLASNGGIGLVQRAPHPPGLADTQNLYNAQEKSKQEEFTQQTKKPSFGANLYSAVIYTYQGGAGKTVTGQGTTGIKALTRATTQLDHEPSWDERKKNIFQYAQQMTERAKQNSLNEADTELIKHGYYYLKNNKYVPTVYGARMYYNDKNSLKPTAGGENASAGASSVQQSGAKGGFKEELLKDMVLRRVGDYGLTFNEGLDIDEGGDRNSILKNLQAFIDNLTTLKMDIDNQMDI